MAARLRDRTVSMSRPRRDEIASLASPSLNAERIKASSGHSDGSWVARCISKAILGCRLRGHIVITSGVAPAYSHAPATTTRKVQIRQEPVSARVLGAVPRRQREQ